MRIGLGAAYPQIVFGEGRAAPGLLRALLVSAAAVASIATGCGSASEPSVKPLRVPAAERATVRCISRAGAHLARSRDDLRFFFEADERNQVDHPGALFTNRWTVHVGWWETTPDVPAASRWRLWAAEWLGDGQKQLGDIKRLIADWPKGTYIAFVLRPRRRRIDAIERCFKPVSGRNGTPVT